MSDDRLPEPACYDNKLAPSPQERKLLTHVEERSIPVDGHYEVPMLWKEANPQLPDNRHLSKKCLESLKNY